MMATRVIAIRHGETDWNVATRLQGHTDIALNARGVWQAQRAAQALASEEIAAIYASDLSRAHATALAIANHHPHVAPVITNTGLRERGFGIFEGQTYAEIETLWPDESRRWKQREPDFAPPGGESPVQVHARVQRTINDLAASHIGQQIVVVAHGGVLDMLYRLATQQDIRAPRSWDLNNAAINRLLWTPDGLTLVGWADNGHLDEEIERLERKVA